MYTHSGLHSQAQMGEEVYALEKKFYGLENGTSLDKRAGWRALFQHVGTRTCIRLEGGPNRGVTNEL